MRDPDVAKDIVQDSFLTLWKNSSRLEGDDWAGYMFTIVKNKCLEYRRTQAIHAAALASYEGATVDYYSKAIELTQPTALYSKEILKKFREQLGKMPEDERIVFVRRVLDGKSYKEIAEELGISPARVDYLLRKAKALVRASLSDYFITLLITAAATLPSIGA